MTALSVPAVPTMRVQARGLAKAYGATRALDTVDLDLAAGTIVAVVGPNGAGKSTLLSCLAGTIVHQGTVRVDDRPRRGAPPGSVAYLPQRARLPAAATVAEVLALFRSLAAGRPDRTSAPDGFLPDLVRPVGTLSGGQSQRVVLTAVLSGAPDLILLDEPLANLDDPGRAAAMEMLAAHRAAGAAIAVASPTAVDLLTLVDRVVLVEDGRLRDAGPASAFLGRLAMTVWVRSEGPDERPEVGFALATAEALPHVLRVRRRGAWLALDCAEEHAVELLSALEAHGVPADRIRIGAPDDPGRGSPSPTGEAA